MVLRGKRKKGKKKVEARDKVAEVVETMSPTKLVSGYKRQRERLEKEL